MIIARATGSVGGGAPTDATYITQTANATLTNEQALSTLATGILKSTTGTGVVSIAAAGVDYQAADAFLTSIATLGTAANKMLYTTGVDTAAETDLTAFARTILDDADAGTVRGTLGLGTIATQAANNVAITGGSITSITDLAVADGGTGASTAQAAINTLTAVAGATNEHVLTKDTATGNAIFKAAAGGSSLPVVDETAIVYKTGTPANTLTFDVDAFSAARTWTFPDAASTFAGLSVAQTFTAAQTFRGGLSAYLDTSTNFEVGGAGNSGQTYANNILIGSGAGGSLTTATKCVFIGTLAGAAFTTGAVGNFYLGNDAGRFSTGIGNVAIGDSAHRNIVAANYNIAIGYASLNTVGSGSNNIAIGVTTLGNGAGSNNTVIGYEAGRYCTTGSQRNTFIGYQAGRGAAGVAKSDNIFIGYQAGYNETTNNKLYIANTNTATPLIYGEFDNAELGINIGSGCAATLHVDQPSATGAKPVLLLDQADIDIEFIKFIGSSEDGVADRSLVDAADMTTPGALTGWIQVYIEDVQATNPITDGVYYIPFYAAPSA